MIWRMFSSNLFTDIYVSARCFDDALLEARKYDSRCCKGRVATESEIQELYIKISDEDYSGFEAPN